MTDFSWLWGVLVGGLTGILSGFGVGGGTLLLLYLTAVQNFEQLRAGGINLLYFIVCALPALYGHIKNGLVETKAVLLGAAAGVPVCIAAALLAAGMDTGLLRRVFGGFILIVGLREVFFRAPPERRKTVGPCPTPHKTVGRCPTPHKTAGRCPAPHKGE